MKDIKVFLKKKNKKSDNMAMNVKKNLSENEKNKLIVHKKQYYRMRKNAML